MPSSYNPNLKPSLSSKDGKQTQKSDLVNAHEAYIRGSHDEALRMCQNGVKENPSDLDWLLLYGAICFQMKDIPSSMHYNQLALKKKPNFPEALSNLGNCYRELGDFTNALSMYEEAIKYKPEFADAHNNMASSLMQLGMNEAAVIHFKKALQYKPELADAHSNLGNILRLKGELKSAKDCYLKAISVRPDFSIAWSNLAGVVKEEGDLDKAIEYYEHAISLNPNFADPYSNLGNVWKEKGNLQKAYECYEEAVRLKPKFAVAHGNMGAVYHEMGKFSDALQSYKKALELNSNLPDVLNNLGNLWKEQGKPFEAIDCYTKAIQLDRVHSQAINNLGNVYRELGRYHEALSCYQFAVDAVPGCAAAYSNMGSVFKDMGQFDQALRCFREAIRVDPSFADAYSNMGNALKELNRVGEAVGSYKKAIEVDKTHADAHHNLASAYKDMGKPWDAIEYYKKTLLLKPDHPDAFCNLVHTMNFVCCWDERDGLFEKLKRIVDNQLSNRRVPSVQPFHALTYPIEQQMFLRICEAYAKRTSECVNPPLFRYRPLVMGERLRIGYVSSDFADHPLSHLMQSIFGFHDRRCVESFCYGLSPNDGSMYRARVMNEVEHFFDVSSQNVQDIAQLINSHGIHVLINLNGYTKGARNEIFAMKPAPVQCLYMGFPGTSGAWYIDYFISDHVSTPRELGKYFSEKIVRMPHSYFVNDHKQSFSDLSSHLTRSMYGLPENSVVYCMFNQLYKLDPSTFDRWTNILRRVPNSVLFLLRFPPEGELFIRKEALTRNIPAERLIFADVACKEEHIKRGVLVDVFLDTPSCNGHTTCCDILWSGTPVVTLPRKSLASRVAASLITSLGLGKELVARDYQEYEDIAVDLGLHPEKIKSLNHRIEQLRMEMPMFDTPRWVRNWEIALHMMYWNYSKGNAAVDIDVPDICTMDGETRIARCLNEVYQRNHLSVSHIPVATSSILHPVQQVTPHVVQMAVTHPVTFVPTITSYVSPSQHFGYYNGFY